MGGWRPWVESPTKVRALPRRRAGLHALRHPALERDSQRILLPDLSVIAPFARSRNAYQCADVEHVQERACDLGAEALPEPLQGSIWSG